MGAARAGVRLTVVGVALALGTAACIIEKPRPPEANAALILPWELSAEQPMAIRGVHFEAVPGAAPLSSIDGGVGMDVPDGDPWAPPDLWFSIVDPRTGGYPLGTGPGNAGAFGSNHPAVCPTRGCDQTWLIVSRWMAPAPRDRIAVQAYAELTAHAANDALPDDPPFALTSLVVEEDESAASDSAFTVRSAQADGHERLVAGAAPVARSFLLRATREVVTLDRAYPLVARIRFWSTITDLSHDGTRANGTLEIGAEQRTSTNGYGGYELEWLSSCPRTGSCEIPLTMAWTFEMALPSATLPPGGWTELDWQIDAHLEALDGSPLPDDAISIEVVAAP